MRSALGRRRRPEQALGVVIAVILLANLLTVAVRSIEVDQLVVLARSTRTPAPPPSGPPAPMANLPSAQATATADLRQTQDLGSGQDLEPVENAIVRTPAPRPTPTPTVAAPAAPPPAPVQQASPEVVAPAPAPDPAPQPAPAPPLPSIPSAQPSEEAASSTPATPAAPPASPAALALTGPGDVGPGTCHDGGARTVRQVMPVSCDVLHDNEIFHAAMLAAGADAAYPGRQALITQVDATCTGAAFTDYVGVSLAQSRLFTEPLVPSAESWQLGDRAVACYLYELSGPRTTSARGQGI